MISISRSYTFSAAHMIKGHPKCGRMHGHNYKLVVHVGMVRGMSLKDPVTGHWWVMDFAALDDFVKPLIDGIDHHFIATDANEIGGAGEWFATPDIRVRDVMRLPCQESTAECLVELLGTALADLVEASSTLLVVKVELWETERNCATWSP